MGKIVFLDYASLAPQDLSAAKLLQIAPDTLLCERTNTDEVVGSLQDASVAISNKVVLDRAIVAALPELELICVAATGTNNIDLEAARELGIKVCNVRDYASQSVAEHVFALILSLNRQLPAYRRSLAQGAWQRSADFCLLDHPIAEISGKTLGIVGYGSLGKAVAKIAQCFGLKLLIANRPGQKACKPGRIMLDELLEQADIVSLHCPLTAETKNLISSNEFKRMKPGAMLINTARGGIVDEHALLKALQDEDIAAAAVDVLHQEPPAEDSVLLQQSLDNLIVTPHIAWASQHARQTLLDQLADIIAAWKNGEALPNVVV